MGRILMGMVRRMTPAQYQAAVRKAQRERKQAIDKYNHGVRQRKAAAKKAVNDYNTAVKKAVNDYNREARAYNSKARAHNARVENQRRRLNQEIRRLNSRPPGRTFVTYRTSVESLTRSYEATEERFSGQGVSTTAREIINRGSEAAANSVYLLNAMDGDGAPEDDPTEDELRSPSMEAELSTFSQDLVDRWKGALFSLSPSNPDAARHFCTSAREVLISMLDIAAPNTDVTAATPDCDRLDNGAPTRRARVQHLLSRKGITETSITDLVEDDMENVLVLFGTFNKGTHGHAGRFSITQLNAIRIRVESAIGFIHTLCTT